MSRHKIVSYIEVPIYIEAEYIPEEKPDYSERSPCPGSSEDVDILSVRILGVPNPIELIDKNKPTLWEEIKQEIIALVKAENDY